ncbi:MAG: 4-hydroxy-tetrahydrodipicolinate synthase [Bacteroidota bacterium]|nr:4-hydroxy-tetrahydrodipicolinate synthase [Bacteroidota bacterium]MEC8638053.1 4-hydroxy-tetrahydrodipicolinate synthase [Bacteroidota bacterium]
MSKSPYIGTGVAVITPFNSSLEVDYQSLRQLINYLIENDIDYLVAMGTTAESSTISVEEKKQIFDCFIETTANRVPLVMGLGGNNTAALAQSLQQVDTKGFSAILSVSPYYNRPTQEGIYRHYKALDAATPLPLILYNVPGRTATNITAETTLRIAHDCPNVIGIKEASGDLVQGREILAGRPEGFVVVSGDDETAIPLIQSGAEGVISVIAGGFPNLFKSGVQAAIEGDHKKADEIANLVQSIADQVYAEGNPSGIKAVLTLRGMIENQLRLPLIPVSDAVRSALKTFVDKYD